MSEPSTSEATNPASPARSGGSRRWLGPRKLIAAVLVLAAAVAGAFVLFGSSSSPVVDPIAQAANASASTPGYHMNFKLALTSPSLGGANVTGSGSGSVDLRDRAVSMSFAMDFSQIPQVAQALHSSTLRLDALLAGTVMYMRLPSALANAANLGAKPWVKLDLAKVSGIPGLSSLSNDPISSDPSQALHYLQAASSSVHKLAQQQVNGFETTHYRANLNLDRVTASVPSAERDLVKKALSKLRQAIGSSNMPVDVWIDGRHLVRRVAMSLALHAPNGPSVQERVSMDVSGYGPQPRPAPPPADQVNDITSLATAGG